MIRIPIPMIRLFVISATVFEVLMFNVCVAGQAEISLGEIVRRVKEDNPEIKALTQKYLSTKQRIIGVRTWEYPQVGVEYKTELMGLVSQAVPFPGKLSLKRRVVESEVRIAEHELRAKIGEVVAETKKLYWEYFLTQKMIEIYQENTEIMERFLNIAKAQYTVGKVAQTDVLKANIELAEMEKMLIILKQKETSIQAKLNALSNRDPDTPLGKTERPQQEEIKYGFEELRKMGLSNRPELKMEEFKYERNSLKLDLAKRDWYPDIMFSVKFGEMSDVTYMLQAAIPLYYKKQVSVIQTMDKEKEMTEWELQTIKIDTIQKIKDLLSKYESEEKAILIYETTILPLAEQTLKITETGYRSGKNSFLDLLDSQKRYLGHNIEYYVRLVESQVARIELERVLGVDLD